MNETIDREEGILLLRSILVGREGRGGAGWARNGLRITRGGYFEETNGLLAVKVDVCSSASDKAGVEKSHSSCDGRLTYDASLTALARDDLIVNPCIRFFEAATKRCVRLPVQ
jgi:hypothetical protein